MTGKTSGLSQAFFSKDTDPTQDESTPTPDYFSKALPHGNSLKIMS